MNMWRWPPISTCAHTLAGRGVGPKPGTPAGPALVCEPQFLTLLYQRPWPANIGKLPLPPNLLPWSLVAQPRGAGLKRAGPRPAAQWASRFRLLRAHSCQCVLK